jgi:hypothetical protein
MCVLTYVDFVGGLLLVVDLGLVKVEEGKEECVVSS